MHFCKNPSIITFNNVISNNSISMIEAKIARPTLEKLLGNWQEMKVCMNFSFLVVYCKIKIHSFAVQLLCSNFTRSSGHDSLLW